MRENKGFTLIELLAVIVILAIIALIATPVILGIIEDSRKSGAERSAEMVKAGVQNAYTSYMMAHNGEKPEAIFASDADHGFMNDKYFTVDSADIDTDATPNVVKTRDDVSCGITGTTTATEFTITCSGNFTTPETPVTGVNDATTRTYTFSGNLKASS